MKITDFKDLEVYQLAAQGADWIANRVREWPPGEALTMRSQIGDSSRAVEALTAEGWGRRSESAASFVNKLSEAEGEASETRSWLFSAMRLGLITGDEYRRMNSLYIRIIAKLRHMQSHPHQWCPKRAFRSRGSSRLE